MRKWPGKVRNATVDSGTNTRPKPKPCMMLTVMISGTPVWSVQPVIWNSDNAVSDSPTTIKVRASIKRNSRPTSIIATNVPQPRVARRTPAVMIG